MVKKILGTLVVAGLLLVSATLVNFYVLHPKARAAPDLSAAPTPEAVARGRYLASNLLGCVSCHSPIDEERPGDFIVEAETLSGREFPVMPDMIPGKLVAPNLTPDRETGIGEWTDGELARAIREGVARDGRPLFPMMNYTQFRNLTDEDTLAVIAYLRSVPPIRKKLPRTEIDFPVSMFIRLAPAPLDHSPPPWPEEPVARGKVLLKVMGCVDCHTPMEKGAPVSGLYLAGGNPFAGPFGVVYSANITSHPASGIGAYSDDDLKRVFREGKSKSGHPLWVMPWSATMGTSDQDLEALIAALREVAPNPNLVPARELRPEYESRGGGALEKAQTP
jgi:mono/diheme cytochrome c family protein